MIRIISMIMIVFTVSIPVFAIAQQHLSKDENFSNADVKNEAEQAANEDINKLLWFSAGLGIPFLSCATGIIAGFATGEESDYIGYSCIDPNIYVAIGSTALVTLVSYGAIHYYDSDPPLIHLLGKSPEYVEFYTEAYKAKSRKLRINSAIVGSVTGYGLLGGSLMILMTSQ